MAIVKVCSIKNCDHVSRKRGWCVMHYARWRSHGTHELLLTLTPKQRFLMRVVKTGSCWLWNSGNNKGGYGTINIDGKEIKAHRFSWIIYRGEIPDDKCVLHKCDVPACVNPAHLFVGTQLDNVRDCVQKGRHRLMRGEENGNAKITWKQVAEIRKIGSRIPQTTLARQFGVSQRIISLVLRRQAWFTGG